MVRETELAERQLKRTLGPVSLSVLGIGAIIGAGIFSTAGTAAAGGVGHWGAGPALMLSFCTGQPTGAFRTARQYENFILEVEWRHLSKGGNSGVFIWGTPIAAPAVPFLRGIEVQVLDHGYAEQYEKQNGKKSDWFTTHDDVFPIHGATMKPFGRHNGERSFPSEDRSKGSPEWNHYRIACTNGVLRLSVNGKEVSGGVDEPLRAGVVVRFRPPINQGRQNLTAAPAVARRLP